VAEARELIEQARAAEAERARVAAEAAAAAAAAAAVKAAERLRLEEEMAALTLSVQSEVLRLQQVRAQLGVPTTAPALHPYEETLCVVCFDAPKQYTMLPCLHMCACEACAQQLLQLHHRCPVCRAPIERVGQVFT
jgi:hypothetical protein